MQRVTFDRSWALHNAAATRRIEAQAAATLPPHTLMQRAGTAVARLALALAPHARTIWVACGPGNNGGDGLEAAAMLASRDETASGATPGACGRRIVVTWLGDERRMPEDARVSLHKAHAAGVVFEEEPPTNADLVIDALLGIGARSPLAERAAQWAARMQACRAQAGVPVLAVDLPSGLDADTGQGQAVQATHTLSLLTLKPGLYTAQGRDAAGTVWLDDLGVDASSQAPSAILACPPAAGARPHASHKGSWGDVAVVGGSPGMVGAALLAADAALHAGAGRVFVGLTGNHGSGMPGVDAVRPELMFRPLDSLDPSHLHVACGCGGGEPVRRELPRLVSRAATLVLDADALNALAHDSTLVSLLRARAARMPHTTVLTPHPLEAARLLSCTTEQVQSDRLRAAHELAERYGVVAVLKGSGTVIAAPDAVPQINPTGNAHLATGGTGDVLAGMVAARMAGGLQAMDAATSAVYAHGRCADEWPADAALTASALARRIR